MAKFRTKARAVDMLGRQQIADASTAINELFKNAHDAYAEHVEVDFFRSDSLLVIRDDGIGMTLEEFESFWLVLGTDSKVMTSREVTPFRPEKIAERAIMGEKGIGRLAIAFLGRQVLVLTRSAQVIENESLVMCYVHWGLFAEPSMNLDDIEIPIRCISGGKLPTNEDVIELLQENVANVKQLQRKFPDCDLKPIISDISDFQFDPGNFEQSVEGLTLSKYNSGTHFYIVPADDTILSDIKSEQQSRTKEFSKSLLGFCNNTFAVEGPPPMKTAFRFWPTNNAYDDLIGPNEFFTKQDLEMSDHFISGEFDEYGQFQGLVRIYDQKYTNHVVSWMEGRGKRTECGPFRVEFGYLQGSQRESKADPDDWYRINEKLEMIGGLYVYRDSIRILPYGNSDIDWLNIESRRNKGMAYYFFSYRRIYGAVTLTKQKNVTLKEKAGREGFQKNKAYNQLRDLLINLFIQLASDFFRSEASLGDYFQERKEELDRLERARRNRDQLVSVKRTKLTEALDVFFARTQNSSPETEIENLMQQVQDRMKTAVKLNDPDGASSELLDAEREANKSLENIRSKYIITRPRGVGLTKQLTREWEAYQTEMSRLDDEVFVPFAKMVSETLSFIADQAKIHIDQRRRLQELIQNVADKQNSLIRTEATALRETTVVTRRAAVITAREALRELRNEIEEIKENLAHRDVSDLKPEEIEEVRSTYEHRIDTVALRNTEKLGGVRELLANIVDGLEQRKESDQLDMAEAMETELYSLREQTDADEEMVQLGLAVAVINHEFEAAIKMIRRQLRELRSWARANDELFPLYREIRTNFDHLDAHLNLFTPLQRRLYRDRVVIRGKEIAHYVRALFSVRLERHKIKLETTEQFLDSAVQSYPSTIYPVFVNLIDNFIFWLKDIPHERQITLDYTDSAYCIGNNGPPIHRRDFEAIFEKGFTRKPQGRGLGLYISRRVLGKEGMTLTIDENRNPDDGVLFFITRNKSNDSSK